MQDDSADQSEYCEPEPWAIGDFEFPIEAEVALEEAAKEASEALADAGKYESAIYYFGCRYNLGNVVLTWEFIRE